MILELVPKYIATSIGQDCSFISNLFSPQEKILLNNIKFCKKQKRLRNYSFMMNLIQTKLRISIIIAVSLI